MKYHPERERLAAIFAREWLKSATADKTTANMMAGMNTERLASFRAKIAIECADLGLQMADHLLTKMIEIAAPGEAGRIEQIAD